MPNYCSNTLNITFKNTQDKENFFKKHFKKESGDINLDFNSIIVQPNDLNDFSTRVEIIDDDKYDAVIEKMKKENEEKIKTMDTVGAKIFLENISYPIKKSTNDEYIKKYGFNNWYDWRIENWGNKRNSFDGYCDYQENDGSIFLTIDFTTARNGVEPIIRKLIEMYPSAHFEYTYEERSMGLGGTIIGEGGNILEDRQLDEEEMDDNYYESVTDLIEQDGYDYDIFFDKKDDTRVLIGLECVVSDTNKKNAKAKNLFKGKVLEFMKLHPTYFKTVNNNFKILKLKEGQTYNNAYTFTAIVELDIVLDQFTPGSAKVYFSNLKDNLWYNYVETIKNLFN